MGKIALAVEYPVALHSLIRPLTDYDFLIASELLKGTGYRGLFLNKDPKRFRVLDSGAFEGETVSNSTLLQLAIEYEADEVVIPDVPGSASETLALAESFCSLLYKKPRTFRLQGVVTGKTREDCLTVYEQFNRNSMVSTIGFSYFKPPEGNFCVWHGADLARQERIRIQLLGEVLREFGTPSKDIHLLGLSDHRGLGIYRNFPFIRSLDTSYPVSVGLIGHNLDPTKKGGINYNTIPTKTIARLCEQNTIRLRQLCGGDFKGLADKDILTRP